MADKKTKEGIVKFSASCLDCRSDQKAGHAPHGCVLFCKGTERQLQQEKVNVDQLARDEARMGLKLNFSAM